MQEQADGRAAGKTWGEEQTMQRARRDFGEEKGWRRSAGCGRHADATRAAQAAHGPARSL